MNFFAAEAEKWVWFEEKWVLCFRNASGMLPVCFRFRFASGNKEVNHGDTGEHGERTLAARALTRVPLAVAEFAKNSATCERTATRAEFLQIQLRLVWKVELSKSDW